MQEEHKHGQNGGQRTADPKGQVERLVKWQSDNAKYCQGKDGLTGKFRIFNVHYDGTVSKGSENVYKLTCRLPGIKSDLGHFKNEKDAMMKANTVFEYWLDKANLIAT